MDVETWKFINTFAPWLSAIGTLSVVIISLYLARAEKPIKLEVRAGHRIMITPDQGGEHPEYLFISAINKGHRIATITNIGWRIGLFKKQHMIQMVTADLDSSALPAKIDDGEEAQWYIPLNVEDNWIEKFSRDRLPPYPRIKIFSLRLRIFTSVGKTFEARIEKSLKDKLLEECKKQMSSKKSDLLS